MKALLKISSALALALTASVALAAPTGYSVNSDAPVAGDQLFSIDLETGAETAIGPVMGLNTPRFDIEGMAKDRFGVLWAVDDESLKLFPIDVNSGQVQVLQETPITGLTALQGNDFGLSFTCEGDLFVSSVATQTLYKLAPNGAATAVGSVGALGVNIGAIAAIGKPARLFGLGNGMLGENQGRDNRSLYEINLVSGKATMVGNIGQAPADYFEAGLSFDDEGKLWAITDRSLDGQKGSQILSLNPITGRATVESTTSITGFESLAVSEPAGCDSDLAIVKALFPAVPTLDWLGRLAAIIALLGAAFVMLRRRSHSS